ncbi:hypothetical protein C2E23DRAFT_823863 [Lenzites betulinus]|nr:hypothetical protein C2E23DRAFT_823863 [Lenzites betulinus]
MTISERAMTLYVASTLDPARKSGILSVRLLTTASSTPGLSQSSHPLPSTLMSTILVCTRRSAGIHPDRHLASRSRRNTLRSRPPSLSPACVPCAPAGGTSALVPHAHALLLISAHSTASCVTAPAIPRTFSAAAIERRHPSTTRRLLDPY